MGDQVRKEVGRLVMIRETALRRPLISPAVVVLAALIILGLVVAIIRYANGLGAISNLNDSTAWGLWISFDLLCGVALASGAFITASMVYLVGGERFRPLLRPAILTGFLGYLIVVLALMVDLGRPDRIWHLLIFWNGNSVMFEVGWCVMLYTLVLALEFSPLMFERLGLDAPRRLIHAIVIPLAIAGATLSTLHQSSLGSLFVIVPDQLDRIWYTPLLPLLFLLTAVAVGPAMVIVESTISSRVFRRGLELDLLGGVARVIPFVLAAYIVVKFGDLIGSGELKLVAEWNLESGLFWLEIVGFVALPMVLFSLGGVRQSSGWLLFSALLVVSGVILSRFAVSLIALDRPEFASSYAPHPLEFAITVGLVAAGVAAYGLVARYLPLFEEVAPIAAAELHGPQPPKRVLEGGEKQLGRAAAPAVVGYAKILQYLRSEAGARPELANTIELHRQLIELQARAPISSGPAALSEEEATERLRRGSPLLSPESLDLDGQILARLCDQIGSIVADRRPELAEGLGRIRAWLDEKRDRLDLLAAEYLREGRVRSGEDAGLDGNLLTFILNNTLRPLLRVQAQVLAPLVDDSTWYRGRCPICGGEPDMAALGKGSGRRRLLCSRCDSEWAFKRIGCPFCGNDDPFKLVYHPSGDEVYRLSVCERCRRYLKTVDLRQVELERVLPAERILTVAMDMAARDAGYVAG
jgi:Ni/Fe-hydrogenase subunit HybB-like protein/formate dehydrogenase maturation protein FdhE